LVALLLMYLPAHLAALSLEVFWGKI